MKKLLLCILLAMCSVFALAAGPSERKFIREGMSEGDVLVNIGRPDSESIDSGGGGAVTVKRWIYLPTYGDDRMLTTIVIREGKVIEVSRRQTQ